MWQDDGGRERPDPAAPLRSCGACGRSAHGEGCRSRQRHERLPGLRGADVKCTTASRVLVTVWPIKEMQDERRNGWPLRPSFGQVLGYVEEGAPLGLPQPNRSASIYTSSHWYLDGYPNAPEPVSEAPRPHTAINPAADFESADEGYPGTPFPRPPREFTRPSFLPDSATGAARRCATTASMRRGPRASEIG